MKIKKNDTVYVIAGKDKKTTGKVLSVDAEANKIKVEGVCVQMKHQKARKANETSGIVKVTGSIDASNVMVVCPACNAHTRVGYSIVGDKKIRVCKKCGKPLDVKAEAKKAAKKAATKKMDDGAAKKKTADTAAKKTTKKPAAKKAADKAEYGEIKWQTKRLRLLKKLQPIRSMLAERRNCTRKKSFRIS